MGEGEKMELDKEAEGQAEGPTLQQVKQEHEKNLKLLLARLSDLRGFLDELKEAKCGSKANNEDKGAILSRAGVLLLEIKGLARLVDTAVEDGKDIASAAKASTDQWHLRLQALQYRVHHYNTNIHQCRQFRSCAEEIELMDEERFAKEAPEFQVGPDEENREQKVLIKRLEHELACRKRLATELSELKIRRKAMADSIEKRQQALNGVSTHLRSLSSALTPLQSVVGVHNQTERRVHAKSARLPAPLYALFHQLADCHLVRGHDDVQVDIEGFGDDGDDRREVAVVLRISLPERNAALQGSDVTLRFTFMPSAQQPNSLGFGGDLLDARRSPSPSRKRKRDDGDEGEEDREEGEEDREEGEADGDGEGEANGDGEGEGEAEEDADGGNNAAGEGKDEVGFLSRDGVVCVKAETKEQQLFVHNLFGPDPLVPHLSSELQANHPYAWVQVMAGLVHFPPSPPSPPLRVYAMEVVRRVRARATSHPVLAAQLEALGKLQIPVPATTRALPLPAESALVSFAPATPGNAEEGAKHFTAKLAHAKGGVELEAAIEITVEYPLRPPQFQLRFTKHPHSLTTHSNHLHAMMREVNVFSSRFVPGKDRDRTLSYQVRCVQMLVDIFAKTTLGNDNAVGAALSVRGRDRQLPLVFNPRTKSFEPRDS